MNMEERKAKELESIKEYPEALRAIIARNIDEGLLCACNQVMIPYFGEKDGEHGTVAKDGRLHGYEDCEPIP